jgi:hypothetical protein
VLARPIRSHLLTPWPPGTPPGLSTTTRHEGSDSPCVINTALCSLADLSASGGIDRPVSQYQREVQCKQEGDSSFFSSTCQWHTGAVLAAPIETPIQPLVDIFGDLDRQRMLAPGWRRSARALSWRSTQPHRAQARPCSPLEFFRISGRFRIQCS